MSTACPLCPSWRPQTAHAPEDCDRDVVPPPPCLGRERHFGLPVPCLAGVPAQLGLQITGSLPVISIVGTVPEAAAIGASGPALVPFGLPAAGQPLLLY